MRTETRTLALLGGLAVAFAGFLDALPGPPRADGAPALDGRPLPERSFAVRDVRLFDGVRLLDRATVVVRDGLVVSAGPDEAPADLPLVEGRGRTLLPGLVDAHTHAFASALEEGADGLAHVFADEPADEAFVALARRKGAFVVPTLTVREGVAGAGGKGVLDDRRLAPFLLRSQRGSLERKAGWHRDGVKLDVGRARESVRRLHAASVPILAGTDAPNPGTAHGASLHRELELLVAAGLTPLEALAAATSVPASALGLPGRGRVVHGARADLLLVDGDPTRDVTATRAIAAVWKNGWPVPRREASEKEEVAAKVPADGRLASFDADTGAPTARFGAGLSATTDRMMGGTSRVALALVPGGAAGTAKALRVEGEVEAGFAFPWAGVMAFPAAAPMEPADLSAKTELIFWARGDRKTYRVLFFSDRPGQVPVARTFEAPAEFAQVRIRLADVPDLDAGRVRAIAFSAGPAPGPFRFDVDEVELR